MQNDMWPILELDRYPPLTLLLSTINTLRGCLFGITSLHWTRLLSSVVLCLLQLGTKFNEIKKDSWGLSLASRPVENDGIRGD